MNILPLGLKRKFTLHTLLALTLILWGASKLVSDYLLSHTITHKVNVVESTVSNAAAAARALQEHIAEPSVADRALFLLVSHLNNMAASAYCIWDGSGKLLYHSPAAQKRSDMPFAPPQKNIANFISSSEIVGDDDSLANKSLQITTYFKDTFTHKNYIIEILFPWNSIDFHLKQVIQPILLIFCAGLLLLYILNIRVLLSVEKRLSHKKEKLKHQNQELISSFNTSIKSLVGAIDARDSYTAEHSIRVMNYAKLIAEDMSLSENDIEQLIMAAQLHDIGKIGIADSVLLKEGKLSNDEYNLIKSHPDVGVAILQHHPKFSGIIPAIRHHHERYDGQGYPCGLSGKEIPLPSRIIAVADAYDAMTSNRPYRSSLTAAAALQELSKYSGTQFDPEITDIFIKILGTQHNIACKPLMTELNLLNT